MRRPFPHCVVEHDAYERVVGHKALRELDEALRAAEDYDNAAEVHGGSAPEAILGAGDLLDDFVLSACRAASVAGSDADADAGAAGPSGRGEAGVSTGGAQPWPEELPEDPEEWDFGSTSGSVATGEDAGEGGNDADPARSQGARCGPSCLCRVCVYHLQEPYHMQLFLPAPRRVCLGLRQTIRRALRRQAGPSGRSQRGPASIADSFWRPERHDRTYAQTVLDETLIRKMDVEYADDEIGSLEDEEVATRGTDYGQSDARVRDALEDFLKNYRKGNRVVRTRRRRAHFALLLASVQAECSRVGVYSKQSS